MGRGNSGASTSRAALEPQDDSRERKRGREGEGGKGGGQTERDTASHCAPSDWGRASLEEREKSGTD